MEDQLLVIRDFITGSYLLTKDDTTLTKEEFANLAMLGGYNGELPKPAEKEKMENYLAGKTTILSILTKRFQLCNYIKMV